VIDWTAVAAIVAALAVVVTLFLFMADRRRRAAEDKARLKREAISRLLDSMESSIRMNHGVLSTLRFWANPDIEYALSVPRLLHDLGPDNVAISGWAFSQAQAIIAASSDKRATDLGIAMAMKIVEWGQGTVPDEWFRRELRRNPVDAHFQVGGVQRLQRGWDRMKRSTGALIAIFVIGGVLVESARLLPEIAHEFSALGPVLLTKRRRSRLRRTRQFHQ